ncbi:MAG: hypothetical protein AAGF79_11865 [Pseudomonadota bacterium]
MRSLIAAIAMVLALPAHADLIDRGYYNGWNVMVDPSLGNGCLIQSGRDGKTLTRIGYDPKKNQGYLAIFNPGWSRLREGQSYPLVFDLDGVKQPAIATGVEIGRIHGAGVLFRDRSVFEALARAQTLTVFNDKGAAVFQLDLTGTAEALSAARECQTEMTG